MKPIHRSLHCSRRLRIAHYSRNEQLRTSRRYDYTIPSIPVIPIVWIHHRLTSILRVVRYNIPNVILRCFVLDYSLKVFSGLQTVKTKAYRIRHYLYVCPHHLYFKTKPRREDRAKISIYTKKQVNARENFTKKSANIF